MNNSINIVEQIKEKADIVEVVKRITPLRRTGKSWVGLCPFHKENTASFHVYEDSGNYVCFGCGEKGDVITFYEKYYTLSFLEACGRLAGEYGIDWQPGGSFTSAKRYDALYEVNRFAGKIYYDAMKVEGNPALAYMLGRGVDRRTLSKFRIGYADGSGTMLSQRLKGNEELQKAAETVGLIKKYGGGFRDKFESRVMFPITVKRGKNIEVIGFGGRDIGGRTKAKYINSDGSGIFAKGSNLYGLGITGSSIREEGFAILVEGYMDLVSLYMHGITNVCAQLGTAFTSQQAKLLYKHTKKVILALDSDESGQNAALRSMDILADAGLQVRVLVLKDAKDPDEFVIKFGREAWDKAVRAAIPMYDFKIDLLRGGYELSASDGLADFLKAAAKLVAPLSPVERDGYIKKLSRETGISEEAIKMQTQSSKEGASARRAPVEKQTQTTAPLDELLRGILRLSFGSGYALEKAAKYRYLFDGTAYSDVMNTMLALKEKTGAAPTAEELFDVMDEAGRTDLEHTIRERAKRPESAGEEEIDEYLIKLEIASLKRSEDELKESAVPGFGAGAGEEELLELIKIQSRIKALESDIRKGKRSEGIGN